MGGQKDLEAPSDTPNTTASFPDSLFKRPMLWRRPKRAVVVKREKGSGKVDVRLFKSVSHPSLLLPPPDALKMHPTYKNIFATSTALTVFFLLSRPSLIYFLGTDHLGRTPLTLAGFFGGVSVLMWGLFKQLQKSHMDAVVDVLYEGVVCRNLNCIETLVQRAQEELLKGYCFYNKHFYNDSRSISRSNNNNGNVSSMAPKILRSKYGGLVLPSMVVVYHSCMITTIMSFFNKFLNFLSLILSQHKCFHYSIYYFHFTMKDTTLNIIQLMIFIHFQVCC